MTRSLFNLLCGGAVLMSLGGAGVATPVAAQEVVPVPTPNADRLADEMRVLAREPRNLGALLSAGELSAKLNDPAAAAGFFARAQLIEPTNPRVLAGQAMVMVRMERPGEALRLFAQAAQGGLAMDRYASDRGLAYDLIGAQAHAQREHRIAMRDDPDDETIRRYALSLGISGDTQQAERVIEPLLRRSDRAAWRARAFILAMNGDAAGADRIAASMMGGFGSALSPFFRRLPALPASDKAFAVHFGEIRRTAARIADASVAPPLPPLPRDAGVAVAGVQPGRVPPPVTRRSGDAPSTAQRRRESVREQRLAAERAAQERAASERAAREAERVAKARATQARVLAAAQQREADRVATQQRQVREAEAQRVADAAEAARQAEARRVAEAEQAAREAEARRMAEAEQAAREAEAQRVAAASSATPPEPVRAPASGPSLPPTVAADGDATPPRAIGGEDNVIARIIAGITIPASELGVEPMPGQAPVVDAASAEPVPVAIAEASPPAPTPAAPPSPALARATPQPPKPDPAAERAAAEKAKAAAAKAAQAKAAAAEAKAAAAKAKAEPARHWVQVAGGANVGALPREWKRLVEQAPAEFRGKQAWTTPLRFTNRLLAGPFKSTGEAQAFVNAIAGKGLSAFAWTSEAGQKIEKLSVK
jgi:chemotaxis protein histidine kinase CheA